MSKIDVKKLESMTKEQKLKLYDTIQKKKEIDKNKRDVFKPHEGQLAPLQSHKRLKVVTAGNGFGKTALSVNAALAAVKGYNPWTKQHTKVPCTGIVVLDNPIKVKETWRIEAAKWINFEAEVDELKNGKPYVNEWVFKNGSRIIFMTHDMDQLVFESIELDFFICDEPPPKSIFIGLSRGQRTKGSKPWGMIVGTPISQAWLRTDLYEPWVKGENPDVEFFRGTTEQNQQNLADGYIDSFSRLLTPEEKQIRLEGQFFDLGGLALAHLFKKDTHIVDDFEVPRDWNVIIAIDPHPSKKHVALALAINPYNKQMYVVSTIAEKQVAADFAMKVHEWTKKWRVVEYICDSLGSADLTGGEGFKSFIQVLNDYGIRVRPTSFEDKKDEVWIERIRTALAIPQQANNFGETKPRLQVFKSCDTIIKDIQNVSWVKNKTAEMNRDRLEISNKDYLACLKYALSVAAKYIDERVINARPIKIGGQKSIRSIYFGKNNR